MARRFYVHYEEGAPDHTYICKVPAGATQTAAQVASAFADAYNARHGAARVLQAGGIMIHLPGEALMRPSDVASELVEDRGDVYVSYKEPAGGAPKQAPTPAAAPTPGPAVAPERKPPPQEEEKKKASSSKAAAPKEDINLPSDIGTTPPPHLEVGAEAKAALASMAGLDEASVAPLIAQMLQNANDAVGQRSFRGAAQAYAQILEIVPRQKACLRGLATVCLAVKKYGQAAWWLRQGIQAYPKDPAFRYQMSEAMQGLKRFGEALMQLEVTLKCMREEAGRQVAKQSGLDEEMVQVARARALLGLGEENTAGAVVMAVLKQNEQNPEALLEYSRIVLSRGLLRDACQVLLRLIVSQPGGDSAKELLAEAVGEEGGLDALKAELEGAADSPAALAFLATTVKDHGAVEAAAELYRWTVQKEPGNASYTLNLVHTLEVCRRYDEALCQVRDFCKRSAGLELGRGFKLGELVPLLEGLPKQDAGSPWRGWEAHVDAPGTPAHAMLVEGGYELGADEEAGSGEGGTDMCEYSADELDALALCFTAVKVLFVGGASARALAVARAVARARAASMKPLHETMIRNEAAYYSCAKQLMESYPCGSMPQAKGVETIADPEEGARESKPLFLVGDSHSLTGAWRGVRLRGEGRLLLPVLVTGLKIWHLRKESNFYPKVNFHSQVRKIPKGSQVVMMFGEIDCREGLLVAVERFRYMTVEEGMRATIKIYIETLTDLVGKRGMEVFVHPVPPVLKETRHIVMPFNEILKSEVVAAGAKGKAKGKLHWLEFVDELLGPKPEDAPYGHLLKELELDGTHMSPKYIEILSAALEKVA